MSNVGLLAYKNRFTNYIVNTISKDTTGDSVNNEMELVADDQYHLVISLSGQEYSDLLSSVMTGADLLFGDDAQNLTWILWRAAKMGTLCEQVAGCISSSADVQYQLSLIDATSGNGGAGTPETVLPEEEREENILPDGYDCDLDRLYATCRGVVQSIHDSVLEVFEAIEILTNPLELSAELADDIPIAQVAALAADTILWIQESAFEAYNLAWSEVVKDTLSCELFCLIKERDPCSLSLEDLMTVYNDASFPNPPDVFAPFHQWAIWLYGLPLTAAIATVKTAGLLGILCMRFGATFGQFSLGIRSLKTVVELLQNDTDGDWAVLCTACDETWIHEWDFTQYGQDDWFLFKGDPHTGGNFVPGVGFVYENIFANTRWYALVAQLRFNDPAIVPGVTRWELTYDMVRGNWEDGSTAFHMDAGGGTVTEWNSGFATTVNDAKRAISFPPMDVYYWIAYMRASKWMNPTGAGQVTIKNVIIEGVGIDPFYGRVTADRHIGEV